MKRLKVNFNFLERGIWREDEDRFIGYFQMPTEFRKSSVERQRMGIVVFLKSDVDKL